MVAPVLGPFFKPLNGSFRYGARTWYTQRRPFTNVLPYEYYSSVAKRDTIINFWDFKTSFSSYDEYRPPQADDNHPERTALRNAVYAKLVGELSESAGWAENLAQYNKTRQGVGDRLVQMGHFANAVRQRRFRDAARILRTPVPSGVSNRKAAAQNFLEYEYGIKPLISDIQGSLKFLLSDLGERSLRASKTESVSSNQRIPPDHGWSGGGSDYRSCTYSCKMYTKVRVINPNLYLLNKLGIMDVALPWKLLPFSFVVDWFINVEQVISSMTDFLGVELVHSGTTESVVGTRNAVFSEWQLNQPPSRQNNVAFNVKAQWVRIVRTPGIKGPVLQIKPFRGFSMQRGAQATALVLSIFGK